MRLQVAISRQGVAGYRHIEGPRVCEVVLANDEPVRLPGRAAAIWDAGFAGSTEYKEARNPRSVDIRKGFFVASAVHSSTSVTRMRGGRSEPRVLLSFMV